VVRDFGSGSSLKRERNTFTYHRRREAQAVKVIWITWIPGPFVKDFVLPPCGIGLEDFSPTVWVLCLCSFVKDFVLPPCGIGFRGLFSHRVGFMSVSNVVFIFSYRVGFYVLDMVRCHGRVW
jgi:hypothetical protein